MKLFLICFAERWDGSHNRFRKMPLITLQNSKSWLGTFGGSGEISRQESTVHGSSQRRPEGLKPKPPNNEIDFCR